MTQEKRDFIIDPRRIPTVTVTNSDEGSGYEQFFQENNPDKIEINPTLKSFDKLSEYLNNSPPDEKLFLIGKKLQEMYGDALPANDHNTDTLIQRCMKAHEFAHLLLANRLALHFNQRKLANWLHQLEFQISEITLRKKLEYMQSFSENFATRNLQADILQIDNGWAHPELVHAMNELSGAWTELKRIDEAYAMLFEYPEEPVIDEMSQYDTRILLLSIVHLFSALTKKSDEETLTIEEQLRTSYAQQNWSALNEHYFGELVILTNGEVIQTTNPNSIFSLQGTPIDTEWILNQIESFVKDPMEFSSKLSRHKTHLIVEQAANKCIQRMKDAYTTLITASDKYPEDSFAQKIPNETQIFFSS